MTKQPKNPTSQPNRFPMGNVVREMTGWTLVGLGIYVFRLSIVDYFNRALTIEGIATMIMGVFLFRGGLQLVKVCVAARAVGSQRRVVA